MKYTRHGRNTYAIGGNAEAAFNAGIKIENVRLLNFAICSAAAGLGGIMTASRLNGATPYLGYPDGSLIVITCVVLGGTSLNGGSGGIVHTLGGTIAYVVFRNGLNMMNVPSEFNYIATGMILIGIVTSDAISMIMRKSGSALDRVSGAMKTM
jgi:ribose transport system permease protein